MRILDILRRIKKSLSNYSPSVEILISKTNLLHNLKEFNRLHPHLLVAPVLKSNAYGHGLIEVAQILDKEDKAFFVVDSLHEAMLLRNKDIKSPLLIIGYVSAQNISRCRLSGIAFTITSLEQLLDLASIIKRPIKIHVKIDTGMHRQGILPNQLDELINVVKDNKSLNLEGICSHFADPDNTDQAFTDSQLDRWDKAVSMFENSFSAIKYVHILATPGIRYSNKALGNMVRLGIGLYGINPPITVSTNLKPVLQMQSIISSVKVIPSGDCVGYDTTFKTTRETIIATIPVGYFEGVDRRLSNHGMVKISDKFCPIIGKVSMNIISVDISSIPTVKIGDKVVIISHNSGDLNSVVNIAKLTQTIPLEILVHIPQHLRRTIVK